MARSINIGGHTPFRVALRPSPGALTDFVRAVVKTNARVSYSRIANADRWEAWVWIRTGYIGLFEATCNALEFEFVPAERMATDGGPLDR